LSAVVATPASNGSTTLLSELDLPRKAERKLPPLKGLENPWKCRPPDGGWARGGGLQGSPRVSRALASR